jgi:polysaccharide chain length determinant protein (PEP-CTERM system associated)
MPKETWIARRAAAAQNNFALGLPQSPSEYLEIVRFRWPWIVVAVVLGAVGSQLALRFVSPRYVSRTVVLVESEKIPTNFIPQLNTEATRDRLRTIHEEILARPRVERILDELNPYPEMVDVPKADVVDMVRGRTSISLRGKDAFVVEYSDTEPERAQRLATRLASMFIEETSGDRARQVQGANEFIDSQLVETKSELERVEESLKRIKQRYMGMLPNQLEANLSTLQRLELERQSVTEQIRVARERRGLLQGQLALQAQMNEPEAQLIPEVAASTVAPGSDAASLPALKAYLAQLQTRYTAEHPEVMATQKRIERIEGEMRVAAAAAETLAQANGMIPLEEPPAKPQPADNDFLIADVTAQVAAVDRDIEKLEARHDELRGQIGVYQSRVEKIPEVEQELQSLERDYELISNYYSELLSRKLEAETAGAVERKWQEEQFKVLDPAQVPDNPEFPKPQAFLLIGVLVGFTAGLAVAFLLEVADPTVKSLRELEALLPYPILLTLPRLKQPRKRLRHRLGSPLPPVSGSPKDADEDELQAAS